MKFNKSDLKAIDEIVKSNKGMEEILLELSNYILDKILPPTTHTKERSEEWKMSYSLLMNYAKAKMLSHMEYIFSADNIAMEMTSKAMGDMGLNSFLDFFEKQVNNSSILPKGQHVQFEHKGPEFTSRMLGVDFSDKKPEGKVLFGSLSKDGFSIHGEIPFPEDKNTKSKNDFIAAVSEVVAPLKGCMCAKCAPKSIYQRLDALEKELDEIHEKDEVLKYLRGMGLMEIAIRSKLRSERFIDVAKKHLPDLLIKAEAMGIKIGIPKRYKDVDNIEKRFTGILIGFLTKIPLG